MCLRKQDVCRHPVALFDDNQIAAHHFASGNPLALAVPDDKRARTCQIAQCFKHALCPRFLDNCDHDGKHCKDDQDQRLFEITEREVDEPASEQKRQHGFTQDLEHDAKWRALLSSREFVVAFKPQPVLRFGFTEAAQLL